MVTAISQINLGRSIDMNLKEKVLFKKKKEEGKCSEKMENILTLTLLNGEKHYISINDNVIRRKHVDLYSYCLKEIEIPEGIVGIGDYTFDGCFGLKRVGIPKGVKEIGGWAFRNCSNLEKIDIPDDVMKIYNGAFHFCKSLTEIHIPRSVNVIYNDAFYGCNKLNKLYIPRESNFKLELTTDGCQVCYY